MKKSVLKTSLDYLPAEKQEELAAIKEIILKHVPMAEMIILFGSYARGDYVDKDYTKKDGTIYEYTSDVDILVVTKREIESTNRRWKEIREAIARKPTLTKASIINHDISFLNEKIKHNYYFFVDVIKEGVMLHNTGNFELSAPQLTPRKRLEKAQKYLKSWIQKGESSFRHYTYAVKDEDYNKAAFELHQAAENYYTAFSLVLTDYKPKTHDLEELCERAIKINEAHRAIFPRQTEEEKRLFELLRKAYVDARYDEDYTITPEELKYLEERIVLLQNLVAQLCEKEIAELRRLQEIE